MEKCLISIIVPVYNVENYISKCIESILAQTYHNLQIILVDDGSTDRSGELCDKYARKDIRIQVLHKANGGLVAARQAGLNISTGKYTGFVDADDYIDTEMLQRLYNFAEQNQVDFVHAGYYENNGNSLQYTSKEIRYCQSIRDKEEMLLQLFSVYPDSEMCAAIWSNLFKRDFIISNYNKVPVSQSYGEDLIAMCNCIIHTRNFISIPEGFYHYRIRKDSMTKLISEQRFLDYYNLFNILRDTLLRENFAEPVIKALKKRFSILSMQTLAEWNNIYIPKYKYPDSTELKEKKIILYGAGRVGQDYYYQICKYQWCKILDWVDQKENIFEYATVKNIGNISLSNYDMILIAVYHEIMAEQIKDKLLELGVDEKKIVWKKPVTIMT